MSTCRISSDLIKQTGGPLSFVHAVKCGDVLYAPLRMHGYGVSAPHKVLINFMPKGKILILSLLPHTRNYRLIRRGG